MSDLDMRPTVAGDLAALDELGRIPFGPRPNQTMPPSWASAILTLLAERKPEEFGKLLTEVITGHRAGTPGRKAGQ